MIPRPPALLDTLRQASAKLYASRAAQSFQAPGSSAVLAEAERRQSYEQGWLDCANTLLGMLVQPEAADGERAANN